MPASAVASSKRWMAFVMTAPAALRSLDSPESTKKVFIVAQSSDFRRSAGVLSRLPSAAAPPVPIGTEPVGEEEDEDVEPSPKGGLGEVFGVAPCSSPKRVDSPRIVRTYSSFTMRLEKQTGPA